MEHKIVEKPRMRLIGMPIDTSVKECRQVVPRLWTNFMAKVSSMEGLKGIAHYGFCKTIDADACTFRYVASTEVTDDAPVPEGMEEVMLPAGKYAVFEHHGPFSDFGKTYGKIYSWLPDSGLKQKVMEPWIEMYDSRSLDNPESVTEIWIPVE